MPRTPFTQLIFTCSKATIETLGKGVKYFKINNNKDTRTTPFIFIVNFVMSLLLTLNVFYTFFSVSIADFEQVNVSWVSGFYTFNLGCVSIGSRLTNLRFSHSFHTQSSFFSISRLGLVFYSIDVHSYIFHLSLAWQSPS